MRRDKWTGEKQYFNSIPWMETEPNGYVEENCAGVLADASNPAYPAYDVDCKEATSSVCQDIKDYFW